MTMRHLPLRIALPLGLALLALVVLGISVANALHKRLGQLDQQARADILTQTAHLARMAEQGWETSRGLVEDDIARVATDPRVETVLLLDDSGRVLAAHRTAWRGRLAADVLPGFDMRRFAQVKQGRLPAFFPSARTAAGLPRCSISRAPPNPNRGSCAASDWAWCISVSISPASGGRCVLSCSGRAPLT